MHVENVVFADLLLQLLCEQHHIFGLAHKLIERFNIASLLLHRSLLAKVTPSPCWLLLQRRIVIEFPER
jgi:hypothetical protein